MADPVKASDIPDQLLRDMATLLEKMTTAASPSSVGACLVTNPGSPAPYCLMLTPEACANLKGSFIGGKCP